LIQDGILPPIGEVYSYWEPPMANWGFYLISDGSKQPYRLRCEAPASTSFRPSVISRRAVSVGCRRGARLLQYRSRRTGEVSVPTLKLLRERSLSSGCSDLVQFDTDSIRQIARSEQSGDPEFWVVDRIGTKKMAAFYRDSESPRMLAYSSKEQVCMRRTAATHAPGMFGLNCRASVLRN